MPGRDSRSCLRVTLLYPLARLLFCSIIALSLLQRSVVLAQVPADADGSAVPRCGTALLLPAAQARVSLSLAAHRPLAPILTRPTQPGESNNTGGLGHSYTTTPTFYVSPGGHFKIWYVTTGSDRPGAGRSDPPDQDNDDIPDWVERCAEFFDHARRTQVDTLRYRPPVVDFQYHAQYQSQGLDDGGDDKFDVYIEDLGTRIAGYTNPEAVISGRKLPAYIVVDNDFAGVKSTLAEALDLLRVTAAHEFFHAVQFNYDANEETYWFEQSAVWMEERVFESVNDYLTYVRLFNGFLTTPWVSLDAQDGQHEFAGVLWPLFLSQRFDQTIIRRIWEQAETVQSLDAMDQALQQSYASNLKSAFHEFTVWNAFTGPRADTTQYYDEGHRYPGVAADTVRSYPMSGLPSPGRRPEHLAANFVFFIPDQVRVGGLRIGFTSSTLNADWGVSVVGISPVGTDTIFTVPLTAQHGTAEVYDWQAYDVIILIPAVLNRSGVEFEYQYSADFDPDLTRQSPPDSYALVNYPNPFNVGTTIHYELPKAGRVVITIYNILGQEVLTLLDSQHSIGRYAEPWDGSDGNDRRVASGMYFYQLTLSDATGVLARRTNKMMLIK